MSVALSAGYISKLNKSNNTPITVLEVELDSGTVKWGTHSNDVGFTSVLPIIDNLNSIQSEIVVTSEKSQSTKGSINFIIKGRDNFVNLIKNERLINRRVNRMDGFLGNDYSDLVKTFTGKIIDARIKNKNEFYIVVSDDSIDTQIKIPIENETKTQYRAFMNMNPADMMEEALTIDASIAAGLVDSAVFTSEGALWLAGWKFARVLTKPIIIQKMLNDLQEQSHSFIIHDGQKLSYKVMAPASPGTVLLHFKDDEHILEGSISNTDLGYRDQFYNQIIIRFDYDESEDDSYKNYESTIQVSNADSITDNKEDRIKTINSKYIRTYLWDDDTTNITGVLKVYHVNKRNGLNAGKIGSVLFWDFSEQSLHWTAPDGIQGPAVKVEEDGLYQIFDADANKYVRVIVDVSALPGSDQSDTINITALNGAVYAQVLANKFLKRVKEPAVKAGLDVSINEINNGGFLLKPSDTIKVTTEYIADFGQPSWAGEQLFLTSVIPDYTSDKPKIKLRGIQARFGINSGVRAAFIAPNGHPDYPAATEAQREYAYIGDGSNKVNAGTEDGFGII